MPAGWSVTRREKCTIQSSGTANTKNGTGNDTETNFCVNCSDIAVWSIRTSVCWRMSLCWQLGKELTNSVPIYVLYGSVCFLKSPIVSPIKSTSPHQMSQNLTFWSRNYFFLILAHSVYKMWIIQEPSMLELWNKLHFEEEKMDSIHRV